MNERYERILNMRKRASVKHPQMSLTDRAAQFAPFAALTGFEASVYEAARLTEKRLELDEYEIERLDAKLRLISESEGELRVSVTYFIKDERKNGGAYITRQGRASRIDEYERRLILEDGTVIPIEEIVNIEEIPYEP